MPPKFTPPTIEQLKSAESAIKEKQARLLALQKEQKTEEATTLFREIKKEIEEVREKIISPLEHKLNLKERYESQITMLENTGILQELSNGEKGIIGIDNQEYPLPTYQEIRKRVKENQEMMETKSEQGFTELLLTPFGMSYDQLHAKVGENILKHKQEGKLLATKLKETDPDIPLDLDEATPFWKLSEYENADRKGTLVYETKVENDQIVGGKTKQDIIKTSSAWQISFLENLPNLPAEGKGGTISGRKQLEANKSPINYLTTLQTNPTYANEHGITPEDWCIYFLTHLEKTNEVIDDYYENMGGSGKISWNLGGYFPESSVVPIAFWLRGGRQACAGGNDASVVVSNYGVRSRVRI